MWNAIQDAAGNFANRASKLAVEVLDAGPPEKLKSHGSDNNLQELNKKATVLVTDRLSALKARYKSAPMSDGVSTHKESVSEEKRSEDEVVGSPVVQSSLDESSELVRLKDQLERLKAEMTRQTTASDDALRQERFEWTEKTKEIEKKHRTEIDSSREEATRHFQALLDSKEQELIALGESAVCPADGGVGESHSALAEKQQEIETLRRQIQDMQQREINDAFGLGGENSEETSDLLQLQHDYEELMIKYQKLEEGTGQMVSSEEMEKKDAFWKNEIRRLEASHAEALENLKQAQASAGQLRSEESVGLKSEVESLQRQREEDKTEVERLLKEKQKLDADMAQLQQALHERDAVWQQELISSQSDQQELRKENEAMKRELAELKVQHERVCKSYEDAETELQNEFELRSAAQAHVKSLQKSMMDIDSGASSVKQQLVDASDQMDRMKQSYEQRLEQEAQNHKSQMSSLQTQCRTQQQMIESLNQRLEEMQKERSKMEDEVSKLSAQQDSQGQVDVAKLTYDLEAAEENLKLAESRNSLLGHEVESLSQEIEQMKLDQHSSTGHGIVQGSENEIIKQPQSERDSCKEQLKRLKKQMMQMQEDQEASLHWRLDAEVKLALEEFKRNHTSDQQFSEQERNSLQKELESANSDLKNCRSQLEQKDAELMNLQIALGELTYHGEAADKPRRDLRAAQEQIEALDSQLLDGKAEVAEALSARKAAEASADEAQRGMAQQRDKIRQLESNLFSVKKELLDASQRLRQLGNDENTMVDRRLVVQLLVAYLEKRHQKDALEIMARTLGFTDEERRRIGVSAAGRGILGTVAGGTMALVKGSMSVATFGLLDRSVQSEAGSRLVDEWVGYLTKDNEPGAQEDPLSYLQKDAPKHSSSYGDRDSVRMTSSEASVSMQTAPRYEEDVRRSHGYVMHKTPSVSSRSEGTETPIQGYGSHSAASELRLPSRPFSQVPKANMPSFKDFMERQKESRSDG